MHLVSQNRMTIDVDHVALVTDANLVVLLAVMTIVSNRWQGDGERSYEARCHRCCNDSFHLFRTSLR